MMGRGDPLYPVSHYSLDLLGTNRCDQVQFIPAGRIKAIVGIIEFIIHSNIGSTHITFLRQPVCWYQQVFIYPIQDGRELLQE